jgi:sigma-B regulation protein RsbU (phosphoserine phosphatase)
MDTQPPMPLVAAKKRPWYSPRSFRAKFILVVGAAVLFDLLLSGSIALWNVNRLGHDASSEIKEGLEAASHEYLENYLRTTTLRANLLFDQVDSEVTSLAQAMQTLIDHPTAQEKIGGAVTDVRYFSGPLVYDPKGNWVQNAPGAPSVISIWGYLLDKNHQPRPDVLEQVRHTAIFDLVSTSLMSTGAKKLQMYYMGPKSCPIMRTTPYSPQAQTFDRLYAGHNQQNFWDFFFPGVYEGWQAWIRAPGKRPGDTLVTRTAPYVDAITGNLIVTFFHPLWNKDRTDCAGAVAVDITLQQLADLVANVKVAATGFGFLTMSNGNVLAISPEGEKTLGLAIQSGAKQGVNGMDRSLGKSTQPAVASLHLPDTDAITTERINLQTPGGPQTYVVVLERLQEFNLWNDNRIGRDHATLGFVVPESEIYQALAAAQGKVADATHRIRTAQIAILFVSLGVVLIAIIAISRRITAGISDLAIGAKRIEEKDYSVRVAIPLGDEVGELGHAFNKMASEIQSHTKHLERRVQERTESLAVANREIQALNEKLRSENVRMGAELDVARRMQKMVLPKPAELSAVPQLDIAGYMEPASEVGGDYYDVLRHGHRVKVGIGDVTGHGFESGVLMLMVQSAVRTLVENGENDPRRFLNVLNSVICKNLSRAESSNNLTLSFIDYHQGAVTLTGQHEEVVVIRASGTVERYDTMDLGFPVGLEEDISAFVNSREIPFGPGDLMLLFTDGVTEAENPQGELFGIERLCASARRLHGRGADEVQQGIVEDVLAHIATQKIHDDITLVVLKHL